MSPDEILNDIIKNGKFWYTPRIWSDETDESLITLQVAGKIRVSTIKEEPMNWNFCYRLIA